MNAATPLTEYVDVDFLDRAVELAAEDDRLNALREEARSLQQSVSPDVLREKINAVADKYSLRGAPGSEIEAALLEIVNETTGGERGRPAQESPAPFPGDIPFASAAEIDPDPIEIEPRPCTSCGLTIDQHRRVDTPEGPEFFCPEINQDDEQDLALVPLTPEQQAAATAMRLRMELNDPRDRDHALAELGLADESPGRPPPRTEIPPSAGADPVPNTIRSATRRAKPEAEAAAKPQFVLYANLAASASKDWLVHNMLGAGEMSAAYGPPGCGKGVIIQTMALHISAGLDWHGRTTMRGAVVYVALERKKLVERRAIAFREKHGLQDLPFAIAGGVYDFRQPATADQIAAICAQVEKATGLPVVLIIIDTVSRALAGGDENSPKDMGALIMTAGLLQQKCPVAHVLWVHHIPHDSDRLRGHGALLGAVDTSVSISNNGSVRTAKVVKANDSEEGESVSFTIESVKIAPDGTTAPVAVPADAAGIPTSAIKRKLPDRAKLGLDALTETLIGHGKPAPQDLALPAGINVVTIEQWRDELCSRNVLDRDSDNHWRDFSRIRDQLAARSFIGVRDSFVWVASPSG